METKSQKELAFLYDLYVATDWAERFAALVDEHVELPKQGRALYVATGTAGHALALDGREEELRLMCVDENPECLEIAQAKAIALHQEADFQCEDLEALSFKDDEFDLVLGDAPRRKRLGRIGRRPRGAAGNGGDGLIRRSRIYVLRKQKK